MTAVVCILIALLVAALCYTWLTSERRRARGRRSKRGGYVGGLPSPDEFTRLLRGEISTREYVDAVLAERRRW